MPLNNAYHVGVAFLLTLVMSLCYHYAMKITLSLRIEDSTKKQLETLAKKMNRSVNNLLDTIIKEYLKQCEYKPSSEESDALYRAFIGKPFGKEKDK